MRCTSGKSIIVVTAALASFSAGVLPLPGTVWAQEAARESESAFNGIVVSGTGEVQVTPDIARISLGVQNQGKEASGVAQENAQKTDALIKAVKVAGVADKDIRTGDYNIDPQYESVAVQGSGFIVNGKIIGYSARNTVTLTVRKIADSGRVIDAAVKAGGNVANGISFDVADSTAAQDAALQKAVADAIRKAKAIAKATGASNLFLVGVQEGGYRPVQPLFQAATMSRAGDAAYTPVQPGQQSVTATVSVRFNFAPIGGPGIKIPLGN
jgi:uncharacterized protein YggE